MYRASRMDNRCGSLLVQMILVLLTRDSRVKLILWEFWVCCFGPPLLRCMVNRRERVVAVSPMYVWLWSLQSPSWQKKLVNEVGFFEGVGRWGLVIFDD